MKTICFEKKYSFLLLILLSFCGLRALSQSRYNTTDWRFSNPKQFGFTVVDVDFFDNNNALAVGSDGGIARTTDGGSNWTYGPFTFVNPAGLWAKPSFLDVHFVTSSVAYAVGSLGTMAKTTDGGITWSLVTTPLTAGAKNINAVWFTDANTGYIGGQWNTPDSIPKLYVTTNGGASWDSMNAPIGGKTRVGYVNNVNLPPQIWDITAKGKEIQRIEFTSPTTGYIVGGGQTHFPPLPAANASTCLPNGSFTSTSANNAALVWKFSNGVLTDYSLSKERLGYSGIVTNTVNCTTSFNAAQISPAVQLYRAINIINDSLVLLMSFNNNTVVRVYTGRNDSTQNLATGLKEGGRYQIVNWPFPVTQGPEAGGPIPATQVLLASNPYHLVRASSGKLFASANNGLMWTSIDTGRTWVRDVSLPQGKNFSSFATWAIDITPSGKFLTMGANGVVADSVPGTSWKSSYLTVPVSAAYSKIEFADCKNGIAAGSSNITVTTDGGATWIDKNRPDFAASFYSINGMAYPSLNRAYFAVSNGGIYFSADQGTTLDPLFGDGTMQMNDVATVGNDTIFVSGFSSFSIPTASRTSKIFRSTDAGATWTTYSGFPVGSLAPNLTDIEFPTSLIGYAAGNRDTIYKTTDGGATWFKLPLPTPGVTPQITYTDMMALDANTVFITGNGFPRKVVFKTTDGGATWTDIANNILTLGGGNLNAVMMSDVNNGYVASPGGVIYKTTNGGASWSIEISPIGCLFQTMGFAPKSVPATVPFANRILFVSGANVGNAAPMMEYGDTTKTRVNSTEILVSPSCSNLTGGSITINTQGGIAPYTYSIDGTNFQSSNVFAGLSQGSKTITIKDAYCGIVTKTVNVAFNDNLTLTTNNDTLVCAGAPVQMIASSAATTYAWTPTAGLSATNISNPVATVSTTSAFTVTASLNGCVRTKTINIGIKPNPNISAGPDKTIYIGDAVTLQGTGIASPTSIAWTPNTTLTSANTYTPVAKPTTTTTYTLSVKDNNSCTSTDNVVVNVIQDCMKVTEAFTPNGDGVNDRWVVTNNGGGCTNKVQVSVFNRYGSLVYKSDNYTNNWDGTYNGKPVADGTYYYMITYTLINGKVQMLKGNVTILR